MKKVICLILSFMIAFGFTLNVSALNTEVTDGTEQTEQLPFDVDAKSALLMEASSGKILYSKNSDQALPPASVTKIMTLLLVMEAIEQGSIHLEDRVSISEYATSMGGSQVFLEAGETMTVDELIKCTVIASANDASVALAEHVSGSEEAFVALMNKRASELGAKTAVFENVTGLDDDTVNHVMSAMDIALISQALIRYPKILEYSSIWMDTIRDGAFTLSNTNRLIRFYQGATGLKTGSTEKAKFCITATATRDGMTLIAVIMGSPSRDIRNEAAKKLLDFGFANYGVYTKDSQSLGKLPVTGSAQTEVEICSDPFQITLDKATLRQVSESREYPDTLAAPLKAGDTVGKVIYKVGDEVIGEVPIRAATDVDKISFGELFAKICNYFIFSAKP